jgi:AAA domain
VIFLDESSLASMPQAFRLIYDAAIKKARIVTLGQWKQHHSVERGDFIRVALGTKALRSVELTETYRAQNQWLKDTVVALSSGRKEEGFDRVDAHGDIEVIQDGSELWAAAAEAYLDAERQGKTALMVCPVHSEAREAAALVRQTLKDEGKIEKADHSVDRLQRLSVDDIELRDPRHYESGRVISFHTKVKGGFRPGEKWKVLGDGTVERNGVNKPFDPTIKGKWSV